MINNHSSFIYSSFRNNTSLNTNQKTAAVSGFSIALNFFGSNVFHNNFGGGLSVIESQINAHDQLVFHHNFATSGGAMALYGRCLVSSNIFVVVCIPFPL